MSEDGLTGPVSQFPTKTKHHLWKLALAANAQVEVRFLLSINISLEHLERQLLHMINHPYKTL